ncbi:hypothetical protein Btru_052846 [Bulinus truncatus]|nr:hypothetical protein Btru_052846 [Bulinus truncatus]
MNAAKSAILLAAEGFAYFGSGKQDDTVICCFCWAMKNNWDVSEDISSVHRQISPTCSMVKNINSSNIPLTTTNEQVIRYKRFFQLNQSSAIKDDEISPDNFDGSVRNIENNAAPLVRSTLTSNVEHPNQHDQYNYFLMSNTYSSLVTPTVTHSNSRQQNSVATVVSSVQHSTTLATIVTTATQIPNPSQAYVSHALTSSVASPSTRNSETTFSNSNSRARSSNGSVLSAPSSSVTSAIRTEPHIASSFSSNCVSLVNPMVSSSISSNILAEPSVGADQNFAAVSSTAVQQRATVSNSCASMDPSYSELGIITERPKRVEYAMLSKRIKTFKSCARIQRQRLQELAEAGFYYVDRGGYIRCFYCGGRCPYWEDDNDIWVEHARWFPECAYLRQQMGQEFVDVVQELNKTILLNACCLLDSKNQIKCDPAVRVLVDMGYPLEEVITVAEKNGNILSADLIYQKLTDGNIKRNQTTTKTSDLYGEGPESGASVASDSENLRKLKQRNNELRQLTMCKICMEKEVAVVFLPCGHLVCCVNCAAAEVKCPVCRSPVKGIVRAFICGNCENVNNVSQTLATSVPAPTTSTRNNTITSSSTSSSGVSLVNQCVSSSCLSTVLAEPAVAVGQNSADMSQTAGRNDQNIARISASSSYYSELGVRVERPQTSQYSLLTERVKSFGLWPWDHHLRPQELAEAGFYYAGYGDCTRCFHCDGGLKNWEDDDDVWVEHARWFPNCTYLRQQKGHVFVDTVQELKKRTNKISMSMVMNEISLARTHNGEGQEHVGISGGLNQEQNNNGSVHLVSTTDHGPDTNQTSATNHSIRPRRHRGDHYTDTENQIRSISNEEQGQEDRRLTPTDIDGMGLIPWQLPNLRYSTARHRWQSFFGTEILFLYPEDFVNAGFYYVGYADSVRCFYCGGGLRSLTLGVNPFSLHRLHFPLCNYNRIFSRTVVHYHRSGVQSFMRAAPGYDDNLWQRDIPRIPLRMLCYSCNTQPIVLLFLPCGHLFLCLDCGIGARVCYLCGSIVLYFIYVRLEQDLYRVFTCQSMLPSYLKRLCACKEIGCANIIQA